MADQMADALWTTPEQIEDSSAADWIAAHTSFCLPLHHWEGSLELSDILVLRGKHKATEAEVEFRVAPSDVTDIHLGFDDCFTKAKDRSLGLAFKPLRLSFTGPSEGAAGGPERLHVLYLVLDYVRWRGGSSDEEWFQKLLAWRAAQPGLPTVHTDFIAAEAEPGVAAGCT
ncbi:hypothetical protein TSOC_009142 [Tetrabaena socialis]|uniref:Uncharacterized protein n=1 Tax=Tetrabaena socialis TaxID=47790 RepID=A0A2J7ZWL7_9CHLO|nr:hypothetical protein TSOC_009142 [Tetrabaena socialis]|eukprot:PNH04681.1 hypothetical protein TSOC_009142 [Tetrabaena socialis]